MIIHTYCQKVSTDLKEFLRSNASFLNGLGFMLYFSNEEIYVILEETYDILFEKIENLKDFKKPYTIYRVGSIHVEKEHDIVVDNDTLCQLDIVLNDELASWTREEYIDYVIQHLTN